MKATVQEVNFRIDGTPQPADRPRVGLSMGRGFGRPKIRVYDTDRAKIWKNRVAFFAAKAMVGVEPLRGALELEATFFVAPNQVEVDQHRIYKRNRPDVSNYLKALEDAIQGIVFTDDCAISRVIATKMLGPCEGVQVRVTVIESPKEKASGQTKRSPKQEEG